MRVTAVIPEGKKKCRVFLEEDFAFLLLREEAEQWQVCEGAELDERKLLALENEVLAPRAKARALDLLAARPRTEAELERRLQQEGYPARVCEQVMALVREYHFVDDNAYAERYLEVNGAKKSRRQLAWELRRKGVTRDAVENALEETELDDEQSARALLNVRLRGRREATREEKRRLAGFLGRRGYGFDVIRRLLEELEEPEGMEEE